MLHGTLQLGHQITRWQCIKMWYIKVASELYRGNSESIGMLILVGVYWNKIFFDVIYLFIYFFKDFITYDFLKYFMTCISITQSGLITG